MKKLAEDAITKNRNVIADFVCPTEKQDKILELITPYGWTQLSKKFEDTNRILYHPKNLNLK